MSDKLDEICREIAVAGKNGVAFEKYIQEKKQQIKQWALENVVISTRRIFDFVSIEIDDGKAVKLAKAITKGELK